jgi:transcriptional regulator with PAS, ATPase and Fis domain
VLVQGESGTGKELVAAEIHMSSSRAKNPFIVINCAAVPETLIESELFGYEKGAFTGASNRKPGMFKLADTGTLFLDEIGDLSIGLQAKLLRALENGEFLPLGASKSIKVDVRIIAATNQDLEKITAEGKFREDLLFRLNVFPIRIPPLRERKEDIMPIAEVFLQSWKVPVHMIESDVRDKLTGYHWPGNVRELRNILERAVILAGSDNIRPEHITIAEEPGHGSVEERLRALVGEKTLPEIENTMIKLALEKTRGNKSRAAELLGITRRTLYGRLERLEDEESNTEQ